MRKNLGFLDRLWRMHLPQDADAKYMYPTVKKKHPTCIQMVWMVWLFLVSVKLFSFEFGERGTSRRPLVSCFSIFVWVEHGMSDEMSMNSEKDQFFSNNSSSCKDQIQRIFPYSMARVYTNLAGIAGYSSPRSSDAPVMSYWHWPFPILRGELGLVLC